MTFAATCKLTVRGSSTRETTQCAEEFTDTPDLFVQHMRQVHGRRSATGVKVAAPRRRKPPAVKPFNPKPLDPGTRVEFVDPHTHQRRTAVVWSIGPAPSQRWIIPDDAPGEALLADAWRGASEVTVPEQQPDWRRTVREINHVCRFRQIFAVSERSEGDPRTVWHLDPACEKASGCEPAVEIRRDFRGREIGRDPIRPRPTWTVVDFLLGRHGSGWISVDRMCPACVLLPDDIEEVA